jgi:hypothetical protein
MAVVIPFAPHRRPLSQAVEPPLAGPPADILFFTGVRYDRQAETERAVLVERPPGKRRAPLRPRRVKSAGQPV